MRTQDALDMLHSAFGPGDLAEKIQELQPRPGDFGDFTLENSQLLMNWMAEQLTDEPTLSEDENQEGTEV